MNKANVRAEVIDRDGEWCLMCGTPRGLHLHRVRYGSQGGKYEEGNCVLLCFEHHALVHDNKHLWQPLLLAYLSGDAPATRLQELRQVFQAHRMVTRAKESA